MKNIELTAIHTAIRLARERCESEPGSTLRDVEVTAIANIELLLDEVNRTPERSHPTLAASFQTRRWWGTS